MHRVVLTPNEEELKLEHIQDTLDPDNLEEPNHDNCEKLDLGTTI